MIRQILRRFSTRRSGTHDTKDALSMVKNEIMGVNYQEGTVTPIEPACPRESDCVIIGGGLMGSAVAYWLTERHPRGFTCSIVERDQCYTQASSTLSAGGIRHQFSIRESVQMSMFTTEFLKDIKLHLSVLDLEPPNVPFSHNGYLFLATDEYVNTLKNQVTMQNELGAVIEFLSKEKLAAKFPWLNVDGIAGGSYGIYGEGWFDPWSLMTALKRKNLSNGVRYIQGEVTAFNYMEADDGSSDVRLEAVDVKIPNGDIQPMSFHFCVNCAGAFAGDVARMAGVGTGKGINSVPLPVEPRKRYVYVVHTDNGPGFNSPFLIDSTGVYFRREGVGGNYICGLSPGKDDPEPSTDNLDVDYDYFYEKVWPLLAHRVPCFESLKIKTAWAGYYDYNYFDNNAIIGHHPYYNNMLFLNGFSGHGVQHALAAARGVMELCLDNEFKTIDLTPFAFERVIQNQPLYEEGII